MISKAMINVVNMSFEMHNGVKSFCISGESSFTPVLYVLFNFYTK